jgi:hypothetical protein
MNVRTILDDDLRAATADMALDEFEEFANQCARWEKQLRLAVRLHKQTKPKRRFSGLKTRPWHGPVGN